MERRLRVRSPAGVWGDFPQLCQCLSGVRQSLLFSIDRQPTSSGSGALGDRSAVPRDLAVEPCLIDVPNRALEGTFQILGRRERVFCAFTLHEGTRLSFSRFSAM